MTTVTERFAFMLTLNPRDAIRGLNKVEDESRRSLGKTEERLDRVGHQLTRAGAGMLSMGTLAGIGLNRAADHANDLNEAVNLTDQVFGSLSAEIGAFARRAPQALGQSERAAREAAADFGLLLGNLQFTRDETVRWSQDLTVLASDMASFKNTRPEDAVLALGAALRGESEPIRRYGVMLDDASVRAKAVELGLAATTSEVDDHGKAQGRLALIMEQTTTLQGDFARTADEGANAARVAAANVETFQANIGSASATIKNEFMGQANGFLNWFNELDPATQHTISRIATLSTGVVLLAGGVATATGAAIKMRNNLATLSSGLRTMSFRTGAATAAVGLLAAAWISYRRQQAEAEQRVDTMVESLKELGDTTEAAARFISVLAEEDDLLREVMIDLGVTAEELATAVQGGSDEWNEYKDRLLDTAVQADLATAGLWVASGAIDELRDSVRDGSEKFDELNEITETTTERIRRFGPESGQFRRSMTDNVEVPADEAAEAIGDIEQALRDLVDYMLQSSNSHIAQAQLLDDVGEAAERIDELTYANARSEIDSLTTEFAGAVEDMVTEGRRTEEIRGFVNTGAAALRELATDAGFSADEIERINAAIDLIDGRVVNTSVQMRFFQEINAGPGYELTTPPVVRPGTSVPRSTGGPLRGMATVGERGIEEFEGVGVVRSAAETRLRGAPGSVTIQNHFHGPQSPPQIEAAMRRSMRTSGR
ncbi:MAG: hypothetical protein AAGA90_07960 [Actinomycetota bacterium]